MYIGLHVNHWLFLSDFNETWILSTDLRKNTQISLKFFLWEPSWVQWDGRVDRHYEANSCFLQFYESAKKYKIVFNTVIWITRVVKLLLRYNNNNNNIYIINQQDATLAVLCLLTTTGMLYMFRTPFASIIRSTINCNSSHWCLSWVGLE